MNTKDNKAFLLLNASTQNPRAIAANVIFCTIQKKSSLTHYLQALKIKDFKNKKDFSFCKALCFGFFRNFFELEAITNQLLQKPIPNKNYIIKIIIMIGIYQMQHMRIPKHAAIFETVNAVKCFQLKWAANLVNAVLRNFDKNKTNILNKINSLETVKFQHPSWFIKTIKKYYPEHWQEILNYNNMPPPQTIRINLKKISKNKYIELLNKEQISFLDSKLNNTGLIIEPAVDVSKLPKFEEGFCSIQDLSAQFAATLLELKPNDIVLDACCAPGGKTCHILELAPNIQALFAVDISEKKLKLVKQNLIRLQLTDPKDNLIIHTEKSNLKLQSSTLQKINTSKTIKENNPTNKKILKNANANANKHSLKQNEHYPLLKLIASDAKHINALSNNTLFDKILLDAPCSATGIIRRGPDIKTHRTLEDIKKLGSLQYELLETLWKSLKSGGILLYSTCSIMPQENYLVVKKFITNNADAVIKKLKIPCSHNMPCGQQILPSSFNTDGFYYAKLQKK